MAVGRGKHRPDTADKAIGGAHDDNNQSQPIDDDPRRCYSATYQVPENGAFSPITVYGADGYMKSDNNILNSSNVKLNADERFTVLFGPRDLCGDAPNRLDVTPGWNLVMRVYRPGPSVLHGSYGLPAAQPVK